MSAAAYRARSATELIDATFQLLRRNAAGLFTLSAMLAIPNAILASILFPTAVGRGLPPAAAAVDSFQRLGLYFLLFAALSAVFYTAMIAASSDAYLGRPVVVADALKRALPKTFTMFLAYILTSICVGIAVIGFIVGSVIVGLMLFAVPCVILLENADIGRAFSRSATLSSGLKGHIFVTFLLGAMLIIVGDIIILFLAGLLSTISPYAQLIVQALAQVLLVPIYPLVLTLTYYDARIRKEGFDIELMAQQVGAAAATAKPQPA